MLASRHRPWQIVLLTSYVLRPVIATCASAQGGTGWTNGTSGGGDCVDRSWPHDGIDGDRLALGSSHG